MISNKIVFIADFFVNELQGGGEIYDHILMSMFHADGAQVIRFKSNSIIDKHIQLCLLYTSDAADE